MDCRFNFRTSKYKCQMNSNREKRMEQKGSFILRTEKRKGGFSIKKSCSTVNVKE
jgi:hypothetical protein